MSFVLIQSLLMFLGALLTLLILSVLRTQYAWWRPTNAPPLVRSWIPIVGHFFQFYAGPENFLAKQRKKLGNVFSVFLGGFEYTFVYDRGFYRKFVSLRDDHADFFQGLLCKGFMMPLMGRRLATSDEIELGLTLLETTKRVFSSRVQRFTSIFEEAVSEYMREQGLQNGVLDSGILSRDLVCRITLRLMMGRVDKEPEFTKAFVDIANLVDVTGRTIIFAWPYVYLKAWVYHGKVERLTAPIFKQRRRWQRQNPSGWREEHGLNDLLSIYFDQYPETTKHKTLSPASIDHVILLAMIGAFLGAIGNSIYAVEGTLVNILANEKFYEAACEDIQSSYHLIKPKSSSDSTSARDGKIALPFLNACFKEYTRMHAALLMTRAVKVPITLPNGYVAQKGSLLNIVPTTIMRDPDVFTKPEEFDPYRVFAEEYKSADKQKLILGFSAGTHKCPGEAMAHNEVKTVIGSLLRDYDLKLIGDHPGSGMSRGGIAHLSRSAPISFTLRARSLEKKQPDNLVHKLCG